MEKINELISQLINSNHLINENIYAPKMYRLSVKIYFKIMESLIRYSKGIFNQIFVRFNAQS